jgi:hypothetical protein
VTGDEYRAYSYLPAGTLPQFDLAPIWVAGAPPAA